jgi:hypothetical protein
MKEKLVERIGYLEELIWDSHINEASEEWDSLAEDILYEGFENPEFEDFQYDKGDKQFERYWNDLEESQLEIAIREAKRILEKYNIL